MNLCRRCYIEEKNLKKKDSKHLMSTIDKYKCDKCGEHKSIVIEPRQKETDYYETY